MITHHRLPVSLSWSSVNLPIWSTIKTAATLYQKDGQRFHLLLTEPTVHNPIQPHDDEPMRSLDRVPFSTVQTPRLLWLEISPYRVTMTMQGNGKFSYRHFWEQGVYGISRYWLQAESIGANEQLRLRNFTRSLTLSGHPLPQHLRIEYELWANQLALGQYVINLELHDPDVGETLS